MRFSKITSVTACVVVLALQTSCLHDKAPVNNDIGIGKGLSGCLSGFDITIRNYFNGRTTEKEIGALFECAAQSFDLFMKYTRGEKTGEYLPSELRSFFTKYFLGDKRISDDLLKEAMILKQAILGGSDEALTVDELRVTVDLLNLLKGQAVIINKYMPIETEHFNDLRGNTLQSGLDAINESGKKLGLFLTRSTRPYDLQNLSNLLLELQQLLESGSEGRGPRILRDNLEVFGAVKGLIFGGPNDSVIPTDWSKIAAIGSRWYSMYLRINNLNARQYRDWRGKTGEAESWYHSDALRDFAAFGEAGYNLFLESMKQHPSQLIPFGELHHLVDTLTEPSRDNWKAFDREEAWRPFDMEMSGYAKAAIVYVVQHVFGGYETTPTSRDAPGITTPLFGRIWSEFTSWFSQQVYLEQTFKKLGGESSYDSPGYTREEILAVPELEPGSFQLFSSFDLSTESIQGSVLDMREVIKRFRPLFAGKENKIYFPDHANDPLGTLYSYNNLSTLNWIRSVSRVVLQGYVTSKDVQRAKTYGGVTQDEIDHLYWDFRSFGIKVGFLDPSTTLSGIKRFGEANLFTSVANGDTILSLDEGMELFAFLISAGTISSQLHQDISRSCPVGSSDSFGHYEIDSACYRKKFGDALQTRQWAQMPGMVRYFQKLTPDQKEDFMRTLENAASPGSDAVGQMINHFETDVMVMIPHYVESIFNRFDVDHSGTINLAEALQAYPLFRNTLLCLQSIKDAGFTSDDDLRAVFTFLLKEGRSPTATEFLIWRYLEAWKGRVHADRGTLLKIFAALANG